MDAARQEIALYEVVAWKGDLAYRSRDGAPLWSSRYVLRRVMAEDDGVRMGRNSSEDR
jgi:hypothetical protein